ncbi:relaxase/mobilization nuclease domain-containing protein [Chitinophaga niabensis]|nr:relaxase/mobilization nuclease domain-containing protein [Chitinophaga niabensis]
MSFGKSIRKALSYNEAKLRKDDAELILASRFSCDVPDLNFTEKLTRFERIIQKNSKIEYNTAHIILSFSPYDKLDNEKMQMIAYDYLKKIGFGDQPYLVYLHKDTNNPHLHIVSPTIRPNGSSIYLHNIGKRLSEPARKDIEKEYGLIPAESIKNSKEYSYSEQNTKAFISNTVRDVVSKYHFSSFEEFNAILKIKGVIADKGRPGSRLHINGGIVYSKLDAFGNKDGIPIKASSIYTKPTLSRLTETFSTEFKYNPKYTDYTKNTLSAVFAKYRKLTFNGFKKYLAAKRIQLELKFNEHDKLENIYFIDNLNRAVFNCNDLNLSLEFLETKIRFDKAEYIKVSNKSRLSENSYNFSMLGRLAIDLSKNLIGNNEGDSGVSNEFMKKKRKKRKPW